MEQDIIEPEPTAPALFAEYSGERQNLKLYSMKTERVSLGGLDFSYELAEALLQLTIHEGTSDVQCSEKEVRVITSSGGGEALKLKSNMKSFEVQKAARKKNGDLKLKIELKN